MNTDQRVIYGSTEISKQVNDYRALTAAFAYTTGQYLYVGSILPFNNLWFEMGVANTNAATVTVEVWWGHEWVAAVDVLDETSGLTASGRLQWNTNINKGWDVEQYSADVTGLPAGSAIYNHYWTRLSWSASFSGTSTLAYIGQKFSDDSILYSFYPDLNNSTVKSSFASGKTDWKEQAFMSAEHIVRDLVKAGIIEARGQLLDYSLFVDASCHKIAEIVYQAFGEPYFDQLKQARASYKEALNVKFYRVDKNKDGSLTNSERKKSQSFGTR